MSGHGNVTVWRTWSRIAMRHDERSESDCRVARGYYSLLPDGFRAALHLDSSGDQRWLLRCGTIVGKSASQGVLRYVDLMWTKELSLMHRRRSRRGLKAPDGGILMACCGKSRPLSLGQRQWRKLEYTSGGLRLAPFWNDEGMVRTDWETSTDRSPAGGRT